MLRSLWLLPLALSFASVPAHAQVTGAQAISAADSFSMGLKPQSGAGGYLSFGQIGEDWYLNTNLRLNFDQEMWGIGVQAPLRFKLPVNGADFELRTEDWDEFGDYLKILRYVYIGKRDKSGPFYLRVGEFYGLTLGHGTIVYRYRNNTSVDQWKVGVNAVINAGPFSIETVIGDVGRLGSNSIMVGYRASVRPFTLLMGGSSKRDDDSAEPGAEAGEGGEGGEAPAEDDEDSEPNTLLDRFVVGQSLLVDPTAPYELQTMTMTDMMGNMYESVVTDDKNLPVVTRARALAVVGLDFGYELLRGDPLAITPYIDINKITEVDEGWGLHMGVLWALRVPLLVDTFVGDLRTEYRRVSGDYLGPYFNTTYDVERFVANPGDPNPITKLRNLANGTTGRNGLFFDLVLGLPNYVYIGGEFIDYDGGTDDGQLRLSLEVPALEFVRLSAFYYRINIGGIDDMFAIDDRSSVVAQAVVPLGQFFTVRGRFWRVWQATPEGGFAAVDDWDVGVGFELAF